MKRVRLPCAIIIKQYKSVGGTSLSFSALTGRPRRRRCSRVGPARATLWKALVSEPQLGRAPARPPVVDVPPCRY